LLILVSFSIYGPLNRDHEVLAVRFINTRRADQTPVLELAPALFAGVHSVRHSAPKPWTLAQSNDRADEHGRERDPENGAEDQAAHFGAPS
jgi:hypothetical protein